MTNRPQSYYINIIRTNASDQALPRHHNEFNRDKILSQIPLDRFQEEIVKFSEQDANIEDLSDSQIRDALLLKVLAFFKSNLFKWVDKLECDQCSLTCIPSGSDGPTLEEARWNCGKVELYSCSRCFKKCRFPRYNHPDKLFETRRGRCGEWAIAFAYLCRALEYDVRLVYCTSDHVWNEVWSDAQQRWVHVDPCENRTDSPLMYECGWGEQKNDVLL